MTHCDFRDAQTIVLDLTSVVYGVDRRDGKSNRITRLLKVPTLVHLQLGLPLGRNTRSKSLFRFISSVKKVY